MCLHNQIKWNDMAKNLKIIPGLLEISLSLVKSKVHIRKVIFAKAFQITRLWVSRDNWYDELSVETGDWNPLTNERLHAPVLHAEIRDYKQRNFVLTREPVRRTALWANERLLSGDIAQSSDRSMSPWYPVIHAAMMTFSFVSLSLLPESFL